MMPGTACQFTIRRSLSKSLFAATCLSQSRTITDACGTLLEIQGFESLPHRSFLAKSPSNSTDYAGEPSRDRSED
jgi:hypothetical protein